jgi:hypothetical protein
VRALAAPAGRTSASRGGPGYTAVVLDASSPAVVDPEAAGRAEAEAFDRGLREIEASERDDRLAGAGARDKRRLTEYQAAVDVSRLKARMDELVAFRNAVQGSLVWRSAQAVRRLLGRAW